VDDGKSLKEAALAAILLGFLARLGEGLADLAVGLFRKEEEEEAEEEEQDPSTAEIHVHFHIPQFDLAEI
jgi:hypothetical protein